MHLPTGILRPSVFRAFRVAWLRVLGFRLSDLKFWVSGLALRGFRFLGRGFRVVGARAAHPPKLL